MIWARLRDGGRQSQKHWEITEVLLRHHEKMLEDRLSAQWRPLRQLVAASAGHHGWPPGLNDKGFSGSLGLTGMQAVEDSGEVVATFLALWPEASLAGVTTAQAKALSWWLPGRARPRPR